MDDQTKTSPTNLLNTHEGGPGSHYAATVSGEPAESLQYARMWPSNVQQSSATDGASLKGEHDIRGVQQFMQSVDARMRSFESAVLGEESDISKELTSDRGSMQLQQPDTSQQIFRMLHSIERRMRVLEQAAKINSDNQAPALANESLSREPPRDAFSLDDYCCSFFVQDFEPGVATLEALCLALSSNYPWATKASLLDSIHVWFSRKRADFAQQVFTACQIYLQPKLDAGATIETVKTEIAGFGELCQAMITDSGLGIFIDEAVAVSFLLQMVDAYYDHRTFGKYLTKQCGHHDTNLACNEI